VPVTAADLHHLSASFDWDAWNTKILAAIKPHYEAVALEQAAREAEQHDLEFDAADPFVTRWFTSYLGERITQIAETTRDVVRAELQSALADGTGETVTVLAGLLRSAVGDSAAFSPSRALTIGRTETSIAYNHGQGLTYKQNGIEHVEISDGDGDEDCADADGAIWTVDEYLANPVEHPNCTRSAAPVIDDSAEE
jgi:hypothetical protein